MPMKSEASRMFKPKFGHVRHRQIKEAMAEQKEHKRQIVRAIKIITRPTLKARKASKKMGITLQIKRGFDIARKWKDE